jgi:hypothetical protein
MEVNCMIRFKKSAITAVLFICLMVPAIALSAKSELSNRSKEDIYSLPESFLATQKLREQQWNLYMNSVSRAYSSEYGKDIKSGYDLFIKEQIPDKIRQANVIETKNLNRLTDLVWVEGRQVRTFIGQGVYALKIMSFKENKLHIIPADILEFTPQGRIVLPCGPYANPRDSDGILSDNDKIFFMAMDAGHRINRDIIKSSYKGIGEIQEMEITCPADKEKAWVYLVSFTSGFPKCNFDLINLFPDSSVIYTPYMFIQSKPQKIVDKIYPTVNVCSWLISPYAGGTMFDIHNKFYIKMAMEYRVGITKIQDQESFDLSWRAWYDGQVIGLIRVSWKLATPLGIGAPVIFTDVLITPFTLRDENFISTPFDPGIILKNYSQSIGEDLNQKVLSPDSKPSYILTSGNKKGYAVEAKMKSSKTLEEKKGAKDYIWHVLTGQYGSMCIISGLNEYLTKHSKFSLEYFDGPNSPGEYLYRLDLSDFKNRQENMYIEWNVLPFFSANDQQNFKILDLVLNHADKPLSIRIEGQQPAQLPIFTHIPNIKNEKKYYKY